MTALLVEPIALMLAIEAAKLGAAESPPASNAGPYVERVLRACGVGAGNPWCCADAVDTLELGWTALALGTFPFPMTASCQELATFLARRDALVETPARGDLWFLWSEALNRFAHVGFVLAIPSPGRIEVQAGNTIRGAQGDVREGWLNWRRIEPMHPKDRFGRWTALLPSPPVRVE